MQASRWSQLLLVGLLVGGATWFLGCGGGDSGGGGGDAGNGGNGKDGGGKVTKKDPTPKPAFASWPEKKPAAVLVLSGETIGYIEPCGCAPETLAGGIGRRHDLVEDLREKGWPVAALDLGATVRRSRRQSQLKFETILAAAREMGYLGIGLGPRDLNLGTTYLYSLHADPETDTYVPFLSNNAVWYGDPKLPGGPHDLLLKTVGETKVAITAVTFDDAGGGELVPSDELTLGEQDAAIRAVVPRIEEAKPDLTVLLAHCGAPVAKTIIERFPNTFDVVLCRGPEEPASDPVLHEGTMLISVGRKGKYVGVVGHFPGEEEPLKYELVHLDRFRYDETEAMHKLMRSYQERLHAERIVSEATTIEHPSGARFVGAKTCGECHTKAYAKWKSSRHAHAFESLAKGHDPETDKGARYPDREHEWISRVYDPECLACHVTGWDPRDVLRYDTGFLNVEFATTDAERDREALLAGQQCENCHGPGSEHVDLERRFKMDPKVDYKPGRAAMHLAVINDPETNKPHKAVRHEHEVNLCYRCHDQDNSPKFDFETYWEKVKHTGLKD